MDTESVLLMKKKLNRPHKRKVKAYGHTYMFSRHLFKGDPFDENSRATSKTLYLLTFH